MEQNQTSFESALEKLQQSVKRLESGELPLEESLKLFEEGVRLTQFCQTQLAAAEQRVELLMKAQDKNATPELKPFSSGSPQ